MAFVAGGRQVKERQGASTNAHTSLPSTVTNFLDEVKAEEAVRAGNGTSFKYVWIWIGNIEQRHPSLQVALRRH